MADVAIVPNHFAAVTDVLAVMTAKAARRIEMPDVVWVGFPIGYHLREKVGLKNALCLAYRSLFVACRAILATTQ